ncbi:cytochrome oxidase small assembly protein [Comamonas sp. Y33R10-2]|nr:cytochrome oxidase small assembly protein [Comamonas sp. Y33R10-2]QXZ09498.1 cytochrome oxidase small assembly protein [Comamonas sp. Y33R10-2]
MTTQTRLQEQRKANRRLGLILASTAAVFFIGFIVKMALLH